MCIPWYDIFPATNIAPSSDGVKNQFSTVLRRQQHYVQAFRELKHFGNRSYHGS
jgi:hypothetical protein